MKVVNEANTSVRAGCYLGRGLPSLLTMSPWFIFCIKEPSVMKGIAFVSLVFTPSTAKVIQLGGMAPLEWRAGNFRITDL